MTGSSSMREKKNRTKTEWTCKSCRFVGQESPATNVCVVKLAATGMDLLKFFKKMSFSIRSTFTVYVAQARLVTAHFSPSTSPYVKGKELKVKEGEKRRY